MCEKIYRLIYILGSSGFQGRLLIDVLQKNVEISKYMVIVDTKYKDRYIVNHSLFQEAFKYLDDINDAMLPTGKVDIKGNEMFAIYSVPGSTKSVQPKLEAHKEYIDIHYIVEGKELFGWKPTEKCLLSDFEFNFKEDYILYSDLDFSTFILEKGMIVIVYPEDAHAPIIETENLKKVVLKILL